MEESLRLSSLNCKELVCCVVTKCFHIITSFASQGLFRLKKWSKAEKTIFTRQMGHLSGEILTLAKSCHTNWGAPAGACQSYLKSTKWPPPATISLLNGSSLSREMQTIALMPMNAPVASSVRVRRHRCAESASSYSRDLGLRSRITDKADGFPNSNSSSWNKEHCISIYHT